MNTGIIHIGRKLLYGALAVCMLSASPALAGGKECIEGRWIISGASELVLQRSQEALQDQSSQRLERSGETRGAALVETSNARRLRFDDALARTVDESDKRNVCKAAKRARRAEARRARRAGEYSVVRHYTRAVQCECDGKLEISAVPNDPHYSVTWGLHQGNDIDIDAPEAWDMSSGNENVIVAVVDTGIDYNHSDLRNNMWINPSEIPGNGIDDDGNGYIDDIYGINTITGSGDPMDDNGHGTHCAGTIGAIGDNGTGVAGVNWNVKMIGIKFLSASGSGSLWGAVQGLNYLRALRESGINVVLSSNSWGGGGFYTTLYNAIRDLEIPFIAAAGNGGQDGVSDNNDVYAAYPASYDLSNIISVAAVDKNGKLAGFSNYGANSVDIGAPGVSIASTWPNNQYKYLSGTSMATPHVAGAVALLYAHQSGLSGAQLINTILSTGTPLSSLQGKTVTGDLLNVNNALAFWGPVSSPPDSPFLPPDEGGGAPPPTPTPTATPTPTPPPEPFVGTFSGKALSAGSNAPVAEAHVELQITVDEETSTYSMYTGADGQFEFSDIDGPAEYTLIASKPGYSFQSSTGAFSDADTNRDIYGTVEAYKLSGYVVNDANEPLPNVLVSGGSAGTRVTNGQGYFEFLVSYGSSYTLSITPDENHISEKPTRSGVIHGPTTHVFKARLN